MIPVALAAGPRDQRVLTPFEKELAASRMNASNKLAHRPWRATQSIQLSRGARKR
jgi:hypothetical protein